MRYLFYCIEIIIAAQCITGCCKNDNEPQDVPMELEAVDLGLPSGVLWASQNLSADRPWALGEMFRWGETSPVDEKPYQYIENGSLTKYNFDSSCGIVDKRFILEPEDDAATIALGDEWRIPTKWEIQELIDNCNWETKRVHGIFCYKITSKVNFNYIYLPRSEVYGIFHGPIHYYRYWTSCLALADKYVAVHYEDDSLSEMHRSMGGYIRPVYARRASLDGISLKQPNISLQPGEKTKLSVDFTPKDALDKRITWRISADSLAFINKDGSVTALLPGSAVITAFADAEGYTSEANLSISQFVAPEKVDLGLPSGKLWADRNIGAIKIDDYGLFFLWGETNPNDPYGAPRYSSINKKAFVDGYLAKEYDPATKHLGAGWSVPTKADFSELINYCNCKFIFIDYVGTMGILTSKINGNVLHLTPALSFWTSEYQTEQAVYTFQIQNDSNGNPSPSFKVYNYSWQRGIRPVFSSR